MLPIRVTARTERNAFEPPSAFSAFLSIFSGDWPEAANAKAAVKKIIFANLIYEWFGESKRVPGNREQQ